MRNGSLWRNLVFEKEVISHSKSEGKKRKKLQAFSASKSTHFVEHLCNKGIFFSCIILLQLRWPNESKFSQIYYFKHIGIHQVRIRLWQLPKISHKHLKLLSIYLSYPSYLCEKLLLSFRVLFEYVFLRSTAMIPIPTRRKTNKLTDRPTKRPSLLT